MKRFLKPFLFTLLAVFAWGCQEDDVALEEILVPTNLSVNTQITDDGSGNVTFSADAENAITYKFVFDDGSSAVAPSGVYTKRFTKTGLNAYRVTAIAFGKGGVSSSMNLEVAVESDFSDPDAIELLTGGSSKTWYWAANEPGHLGVGQNNDDASGNYYPNFYQAAPFEKNIPGEAACLYEDKFIFSVDGETLKYEYDNGGSTYFNGSYESVVGGSAGFDFCYEYETAGESTVILSPSESFVAGNNVPSQTRGTVMTFVNPENFMGYYVGSNEYEIISLTQDRMVVRTVMGNDDFLAWYHTFTTTKPVEDTTGEEDDFDNLVWSDEFDTPGAPNPDNWGYDIGTGDNGWGNGESQYYTDRPDNVIVEDGLLKITAQRENFQGQQFTSSRILSKDKFEFTYGRVEARAKLPTGGGTWPAIWTLGADFETNPWPAAGEMDIMEHVGNEQNTIFSSLHYPGNSAGNAVTESLVVEGVSDDFHVYAMEWTETQVRFYVDDEEYHVFQNNESLPFNKNFFLILNVAMGGNFGGNIDPNFTSSTMEVDYIRVYQKS